MELTNEAYNAINRYFSALTHLGYKAYTEVENLLVLTFLEELLTGPMSQYITEEDYNTISSSLYCIYGSCMIPFPDYRKAVDGTVARVYDEYRTTEDGILRLAETSQLRAKS